MSLKDVEPTVELSFQYNLAMALPAKHRLPLRTRRQTVESLGFPLRGKNFTIVKHIDPEIPLARFAVIISRKTVSLSATRHLLKRRILGAIQSQITHLSHGDYLIIPRASAVHLTSEQIGKEIFALLK